MSHKTPPSHALEIWLKSYPNSTFAQIPYVHPPQRNTVLVGLSLISINLFGLFEMYFVWMAILMGPDTLKRRLLMIALDQDLVHRLPPFLLIIIAFLVLLLVFSASVACLVSSIAYMRSTWDCIADKRLAIALYRPRRHFRAWWRAITVDPTLAAKLLLFTSKTNQVQLTRADLTWLLASADTPKAPLFALLSHFRPIAPSIWCRWPQPSMIINHFRIGAPMELRNRIEALETKSDIEKAAGILDLFNSLARRDPDEGIDDIDMLLSNISSRDHALCRIIMVMSAEKGVGAEEIIAKLRQGDEETVSRFKADASAPDLEHRIERAEASLRARHDKEAAMMRQLKHTPKKDYPAKPGARGN